MLAEFIKLPNEGETVGRFILGKVLSTSILGNFYQARDTAKNEEVLLHIIPEALKRADPGFLDKYKQEMERQKGLPAGPAMPARELIIKNGHIMVLYKAGTYQNFNDLILGDKELLPEALVQKVLLSVAKGLAEAEKIGQGHFFLTPDFLFFNKSGEVCIGGLGLFQSIDYPAFEHFVSGSLVPISIDKSKSFSALEILSPEIRNFKTRDHRTDFFCLGMCAYFLLLGQKPERKWKEPRRLREDICEGWDILISRCLEPRPIDRYPNYRAFMRELEHLEELTGAPRRDRGRLHEWLNRIPVPYRLERKLGMRYLVLFRVAIIIFNVLIIAGAGILLKQALSTSSAGPEIRQITSADKASIILNIVPAKAVVTVKGAENGRFLVQDGQLMLRGEPGKYTITVNAADKQPMTLELQFDGPTALERNINLSQEFASVHVEGELGTEVYVTGKEGLLLHVGTIDDSSGVDLDNRLLPGTYKLVGLHENFEPARLDSVDIDASTTSVSFEQVSKPTSLAMVSSPEGASVYIDGVRLGETPVKIAGLEVGKKMEVRIEKPGYRSFVQNIEFSAGQSIMIDAGDLARAEGTLIYGLDMSMKDPPELQELSLSINGRPVRVEREGVAVLPAGKNTIRLEHPDYYPLEQEITVEDGKSASLTLVLQPRPVRLIPIVTSDNPTRFLVDGVVLNPGPDGFIPLPANKPVTVEAIVQNHLDVVQTFAGDPNERIEWTVPLKPIPGPEFGNAWEVPYFNIDMSWIEPGRFSMGSPVLENRRIPNEDNLTDVRFTQGFWIARKEITQSVFRKVMGENPSQFKGDDLPVDFVTWEMAVEFCRRLTEFETRAGRLPEGYAYQLPTEAQWEYAARAGTETPFSFGTHADPAKGNFQGAYSPDSTVGQSAESRYGTLPAGTFDPNNWGLYDVHGNVAEWTRDLYWDRHPGGSVENPYNNEKGEGHPIRGGSWEDPAYRVRSAARSGLPSDSRRNSIGFRIVLSPDSGTGD